METSYGGSLESRACTAATQSQALGKLRLPAISRHSRNRHQRLRDSSARGVAGATALQCTGESDSPLRSSRLLAGAKKASRGRPSSRGKKESDCSDSGDRPRLRGEDTLASDRFEPHGWFRSSYSQPVGCSAHRFRTKRQFWIYCGLSVVTRSSSDWAQTADGGWIKARIPQTQGLSRQHNHFLKSI